MITPEQAEKSLARFADPTWVQTRVRGLGRAPGAVKAAGRLLLGKDKDLKRDDDDFHLLGVGQQRRRAAEALATIDADEQERLVETLFPDLLPHVHDAWRLHTRLPYTIGYGRRPFRAPHDQVLLAAKRSQWLLGLVKVLKGRRMSIVDLAEWAAFIAPHGYGNATGLLLAAALDRNDDTATTVFDTLEASASGTHEAGQMGRHVITAMLATERREGWEFVERLLLAAQREEGLRQAILETADESHPDAFRHLLGVVHEHGLVRFSAVARAIDVWYGFMWDAASTPALQKIVETTIRMLDDPAARTEAIERGEHEDAYHALWAEAFHDAPATVPIAARLLEHEDVGRRYVAAHLLAQLGLPDAERALVIALNDEDDRVVERAVEVLGVDRPDGESTVGDTDCFERLARIVERMKTKSKMLEPLVWPWASRLDRSVVAEGLHAHLGSRPHKALAPYLRFLDPWSRWMLLGRLAAKKPWSAEIRGTILASVGDPSPDVRERAIELLARARITDEEAAALEPMLTRKSGDLRRGVLSMLAGQKQRAALASAGRLLESRDAQQRLGGLELLRLLVDRNRSADAARDAARRFAETREKISPDERVHLDEMLGTSFDGLTLIDGLGLFDPAGRTPPTRPRPLDVRFFTPAALACLESLDALVERHRDEPIRLTHGREEALLGDIRWGFPMPSGKKPVAEQLDDLPLREVWESWLVEREGELRDDDGFEFFRAAARLQVHGKIPDHQLPSRRLSRRSAPGRDRDWDPNRRQLLASILSWLIRMAPPRSGAAPLLDALESFLARLTPADLVRTEKVMGIRMIAWRESGAPATVCLRVVRGFRASYPELWTTDDAVRLYGLLRYTDEPGVDVARSRPQLGELLAAFEAGAATDGDVLDDLIGVRSDPRRSASFDSLAILSGTKVPARYASVPRLDELVDRVRRRLVQIELRRGDSETPASEAALQLRTAGGLASLVPLLVAIGRLDFVRGWASDRLGKAAALSHLVRATFPAESDTGETLAAAAKEAGIKDRRLIEVAVFAPQWAAHVEAALGWDGLEDSIWWVHAHTKDYGWNVHTEVRAEWKATASQHTPLTDEDLLDGGVDVAWFQRAYGRLGRERWEQLDKAVKYASGGGGHKRAQLFADAMLRRVKKGELTQRIDEKRHQDSVRAIGLLPLAGGKGRRTDLLRRYAMLQEFIRQSREFGSQRQTSEKRAATIGMANLARTAGYPDPVRLQWAMEAEAVADLAEGPVTVAVDDVSVSLLIDHDGRPDLRIMRKDRTLKSVPAPLRKNTKIATLRERKTDLNRQVSRIRRSLEEAMCRGDRFTGSELQELFANPMLAPALGRLIFVGENLIGYPVDGGLGLERHDAHVEPVRPDEAVRIAHPHDLFIHDDWHEWQRHCFRTERVQPFKQVFRELYVLTAHEAGESNDSRRYAGHQVNPRQALALLGGRQWVTSPDVGVCRTFHDEDLTVWLGFEEYFHTPAEIEGLTIDTVQFTRRGTWKSLPLPDVPPLVFSEVMRDLDLVVSVAHRGGVDPEASASTVEMRAALLRETCTLLGLDNVRAEGNHAFITGELGEYTLHLGSAVTHLRPGGALFIVPVHAQHRGRLFLPFADDDPKTAEVLSKILLLARDRLIKDPAILDQIRRRSS